MAWKLPTLARVANGWSMNTDTMGVYGNYYLKRAIVTQVGLGANLPDDAIYPLNLADDTGKPLDGASNYTIHFDKGETPPADAFWSITLYDPRVSGRQFVEPLRRVELDAVQDTIPTDRSISISRTRAPAPTRKRTGCRRRRVRSPHHAPLRAEGEALTGKWNPPPVTKAP